MIHARDEDFVDIMAIFKKYKEWLGHIRHDYVKQMIMNNAKKFDFTSNFISKHKGTSLLIFERDAPIKLESPASSFLPKGNIKSQL